MGAEKTGETVFIRGMGPADLDVGMRLKAIPNWNQTRADWEAFLQLEPEGCFVAEVDGKVVATATAIQYGLDLGWIGMILVDLEYRRRGIATLLMQHSIDYLEQNSCRCIKLDATAEGAEVYQRMGFEVEYQVERWRRDPGPLEKTDLPGLCPAREATLEGLRRSDFDVFGADRTRLLRWYLHNGAPTGVVEREGRISGYGFGRAGSNAFQIGPIVAADPGSASELVVGLLEQVSDQTVIVDLISHNTPAVELFSSLGFSGFRVLKRMFRGQNLKPGRPLDVFSLSGFEYG